MHFDWLTLAGPLLSLVALAIGGLVSHKIGTAADHAAAFNRAQLLSHVAGDAAALVVSLFPAAPWATLLNETVKQIAKSAGLSVTDSGAIERAAAGALVALGKAPAPPTP